MYLKKLPEDLLNKTAIAEIIRVKDDEDKTIEFSLPRTQSVRVFAIGEGQAGAMFDYGWIESAGRWKASLGDESAETLRMPGAQERIAKLIRLSRCQPGSTSCDTSLTTRIRLIIGTASHRRLISGGLRSTHRKAEHQSVL